MMYLDDCAYQVSSPYKVYNLLAVANVSEKYLRIYGGATFEEPRKPPFTHLKKTKNLCLFIKHTLCITYA